MPSAEKLSVQVAPVVYREAPRDLFLCITRDINEWANRQDLAMSVSWVGQDADIGRLRSMTVSDFYVRSQHDVLVMIDADTTWQLGDIERVARKAQECRGIVAGMVPKRAKSQGVACFPMEETALEQGKDELLPCTYVGAAFMAIHRDAVERIIGVHKIVPDVGFAGVAYFWALFQQFSIKSRANPGMGEYLSEDYAFCVRAVTAGVPVFLDQKPKLGHVGAHEFTIAEALDGAPNVGGIDPLGLLAKKEDAA